MLVIAVLIVDSSGRAVVRKESTLLVIKVVSIQNCMDKNT